MSLYHLIQIPWKLMLFGLGILLIVSCTSRKNVIVLKDSDKIYFGKKGKWVCEKVNFDCVVMSKTKFRELTN